MCVKPLKNFSPQAFQRCAQRVSIYISWLAVWPEREIRMKKYTCTVCGWVYDEAAGDPDNGIAPGTKWEDLPDDFVCPLCGVGKDQFEEA